MTLFWIIAALLLAVALIFVVPPLLSKASSNKITSDELNLSLFQRQLEELEADLANGVLDQERYEASRADLEKELLADVSVEKNSNEGTARSGRWALPLLVLALPVVSILIYFVLGSQDIIPRLEQLAASGPAASTADTDNLPPMEDLVARLAQRMQEQPDNPEGWLMLGRSYLALKQPHKAIEALEDALQRAGDNPDILLALAEALASTKGNDLSGRPTMLVSRALEISPQDSSVLWMMGLVHFQKEAYSLAIKYWEQLASQLEPGSEDATTISGFLQEARGKLDPSNRLPPIATAAANTAPAPGEPVITNANKLGKSAIKVQVNLAPRLRAQASESDRVFIFARAAQGPKMPLAASRATVADLPITVTLDDSMAMTPELVLSNFKEVIVGARISKSGNAIPQSGDLQGEIKPVVPGQEDPVTVVIDNIRP